MLAEGADMHLVPAEKEAAAIAEENGYRKLLRMVGLVLCKDPPARELFGQLVKRPMQIGTLRPFT